jgi:hypothetical protein
MRILHLAIENFAGIPMRLVREERRRGHESRLITLLTPMQKYEEDISLRLPALNLSQMKRLRSLVRGAPAQTPLNIRREGSTPRFWSPANALDAALFRLRDRWWLPRAQRTIRKLGGLEQFDLIIADGGHDFTRFPRLLLESSAPVFTIYYGSDMRVRGIIEPLERKALRTFTFEYDHTLLLPEARFLFYPYEEPDYAPTEQERGAYRPPREGETIRVGHAPTNRAAKGTNEILAALESLRSEYPLEIVLIENLSHREALRLKATCHLFVDQIGELGYGVNSIESLVMGIPTATEILPDFHCFLCERCGEEPPFYQLTRARLQEDFRAIFADISRWQEKGAHGKRWAQQYHAVQGVVDEYLPKEGEKLHR